MNNFDADLDAILSGDEPVSDDDRFGVRGLDEVPPESLPEITDREELSHFSVVVPREFNLDYPTISVLIYWERPSDSDMESLDPNSTNIPIPPYRIVRIAKLRHSTTSYEFSNDNDGKQIKALVDADVRRHIGRDVRMRVRSWQHYRGKPYVISDKIVEPDRRAAVLHYSLPPDLDPNETELNMEYYSGQEIEELGDVWVAETGQRFDIDTNSAIGDKLYHDILDAAADQMHERYRSI